MNAFYNACITEQQGMAILLPWLENRAFDGRGVVLTAKGNLSRLLQKRIGDILMNARERDRVFALEAVKREPATFFLEMWSNRNLDQRVSYQDRGQTVGWLLEVMADWLLYFFLDTGDLYAIPVFELKRWAFGFRDESGSVSAGRIYAYPERIQRKRHQPNDTCGRCVPVRVIQREVTGVRHFNIRDLVSPLPFMQAADASVPTW